MSAVPTPCTPLNVSLNSSIGTLDSKLNLLCSAAGSGSTGTEAAQDFIDSMASRNCTFGIGAISFGGYSYIAVGYRMSNTWASLFCAGYNGATRHIYKENGTWKNVLIKDE